MLKVRCASALSEFGIPTNRERHVPNEIEHKYLVLKEAWKPSTSGVLYRQGYLSSTKERVVQVRIAGDRAYLTVKGPATGVTRLEFEYPIPIDNVCDHARPSLRAAANRKDALP